jgi:uncharacterized membrane protein SirB2
MNSLAAWYPWIKQSHIALVVASGTLFALRGMAVLAGARWPRQATVRVASVVIDTLLLGAGVTLWTVLQLNPIRDHWLAAKLVLLVLYVVLGTLALKGARSAPHRLVFLLAAMLTFATMVGVALTHHPLGFWRWA